LYI
jgi:hypothetical protein